VSHLDLNDFFDVHGATSLEEQGDCLIAIGAALRRPPRLPRMKRDATAS
jgi:hypothetical protein